MRKPSPQSYANPGLRVASVDPGSPADRSGIRPGDRLLAINGQHVRDELDLLFLSADSPLRVHLISADGQPRRVSIRKSDDTDLGTDLDPLSPTRCGNKCVFCFIDQNPPGLRSPLYVKDEDFRLSFTHGHYITTTTLQAADLERIVEQRLSPLYVSVHATSHELRCRMLGRSPRRTPDILETLRYFVRNSISLHAQIVLCPGWNDGPELDRALDDLEEFLPSLLSIAIVPVGLTEHREGLPALELVTPTLAGQIIAQVAPRQMRLLEEHEHRIVLLADEFYLLADLPLPDYSEEEVQAQIENGVGMVQELFEGWPPKRLPKALPRPLRVAILTSPLGARAIDPVIADLNRIEGLEVSLAVLENTLYGPSVTVSGLLPGTDIDRALARVEDLDLAVIPANALRPDDERFLDDLTLDELRSRHPGVGIETVGNSGLGILETIVKRAKAGQTTGHDD